jgi:uncharacterized protein (UPF0305 family)
MGDAELPPRAMALPVKDDLLEIRRRIKSKSGILQKFLHFEASVRPHIQYLEKDIRELQAAREEQEKRIKEMLNELRDVSDAKPKEMTDKQRRHKLTRIRKLEATYENLLKEKAFHLARAAEPLEDIQ